MAAAPWNIMASAGGVGSQGPAGAAFTFSSADFVVPAVGSTVAVTVADTSWMTVGQVVWIAGAGGAGQAGAFQIAAINGNTVTLFNPMSSEGIPGPQGPPGVGSALLIPGSGIPGTTYETIWTDFTNYFEPGIWDSVGIGSHGRFRAVGPPTPTSNGTSLQFEFDVKVLVANAIPYNGQVLLGTLPIGFRPGTGGVPVPIIANDITPGGAYWAAGLSVAPSGLMTIYVRLPASTPSIWRFFGTFIIALP